MHSALVGACMSCEAEMPAQLPPQTIVTDDGIEFEVQLLNCSFVA